MQAAGFWMDIIRELLFGLDKVVYGLIESLYNLFAYVSNLTIFNNSDFQNFANKIYLILGLVMLFKIAFSLITMFANPDDLMDSQKGVTGIIKRIIISLVVITFVPTIFNVGYRIQMIVIRDNVVGNFFLGGLVGNASDDTNKQTIQEVQQNAGKMIAFEVLSAFYYPESFALVTNEDGSIKRDENGNIEFRNPENWSSMPGGVGEDEVSEYFNNIRNKTFSIDDYGKFVKKDYRGSEMDDTYYIMHYSWFISTIAGVVVAWVFLGFCIDTATRAVKLSVLQLIAPIPIFSYIDLKKGESIFKNWVQTTVSSYLSLFGRLVLIYFVLYVCYLLQQHGLQQFYMRDGELVIDNMARSDLYGSLAKALIYIGLFLFAFQAPKLLGDMFGIKSEGSFGSKLAKMGIAATGLAVGVGSAKYLGNRYKRTLTKRANRKKMAEMRENGEMYNDDGTLTEKYAKLANENKLRTGFMSSGKAVFHGMTAGAIGGWQAKKMSMGGLKSGVLRANKIQKAREDGTSFLDELKETANQYAGVPNKYGTFGEAKEKLKKLQNQQREFKGFESRFREQYSDQWSKAIEQFDISPEMAEKFRIAISSGDEKSILKLKSEIAEAYAEPRFAKNAKERNDAIREVKDSLDLIQKKYEYVKLYDKKEQDIEKQIKDTQNQIDIVKVGK